MVSLVRCGRIDFHEFVGSVLLFFADWTTIEAMSKVHIAPSRKDIARHLELALAYGSGLEIQAFSDPDVLQDSWRPLLQEYKALLKDFPGSISCHGAFFDMYAASFDPRVVALTRERYLLNLDIAAGLGATRVVFHTNFLPMIRTESYRHAWLQNQRAFLLMMELEAAQRGLELAIENMWDPDPHLMIELFADLPVPHIGVCLDVSHAYLYRFNRQQPVEFWLRTLSPYITHVHMNNTRGVIDEHLALNAQGGALNYAALLPALAELERDPILVVEIDEPEAAEQSLQFINHVLGSRFCASERKTLPPCST